MRGNPDYGLAIIDHPIVILTHEQLLERAFIATPQAVEHLVDR
jgi:hypothetical protein